MYDIIIGRSEGDKKKLGTEGTVLLGKHYVRMGRTITLSNKIYMDVTKSHVVFVCGKRGSGKCLTGNTLITLENGLEIPIKELEKSNQKIFGINEKFKIKPFSKQGFYKRKVNQLFKIRLRSGREIKLTPEHPLLTIEGWKPANSLAIGSRIATPRRINDVGIETLPDSHIKILAYLIAEGHTKKQIMFSNGDEEIVNDFKQALVGIHPGLELVQLSNNYCYQVRARKIKRKVLGH
jgi:replicative DNA helicase